MYTRPYPSRQSTALHSPLLTHSKKLAKTAIAQGIGVNVDQSGGVMETGIAWRGRTQTVVRWRSVAHTKTAGASKQVVPAYRHTGFYVVRRMQKSNNWPSIRPLLNRSSNFLIVDDKLTFFRRSENARIAAAGGQLSSLDSGSGGGQLWWWRGQQWQPGLGSHTGRAWHFQHLRSQGNCLCDSFTSVFGIFSSIKPTWVPD